VLIIEIALGIVLGFLLLVHFDKFLFLLRWTVIVAVGIGVVGGVIFAIVSGFGWLQELNLVERKESVIFILFVVFLGISLAIADFYELPFKNVFLTTSTIALLIYFGSNVHQFILKNYDAEFAEVITALYSVFVLFLILYVIRRYRLMRQALSDDGTKNDSSSSGSGD
jgi:hypothetical protein